MQLSDSNEVPEHEDKTKRRKQLINNFNENVTLHGYRYMFQEKGLRKIIWVIITGGALALSVVLFFDLFVNYLKFKSYSVIEKNYNKREADFPTVTLCNLNSVSKSKISKLPVNITAKEFVEFLQLMQRRTKQSGDVPLKMTRAMGHMKDANITSVKDMMSLYEIDLNDMLNDSVTKSFKNNPCTFETKKCNVNNFSTTMSWDFSTCFQFNSYESESKTSLISKMAGFRGGLQLFLNIHSNDMINAYFPFQGIAVIIHPYGTPHFLSTFTSTISVSPGSLNVINVGQRRVSIFIWVLNLFDNCRSCMCNWRDFKV